MIEARTRIERAGEEQREGEQFRIELLRRLVEDGHSGSAEPAKRAAAVAREQAGVARRQAAVAREQAGAARSRAAVVREQAAKRARGEPDATWPEGLRSGRRAALLPAEAPRAMPVSPVPPVPHVPPVSPAPSAEGAQQHVHTHTHHHYVHRAGAAPVGGVSRSATVHPTPPAAPQPQPVAAPAAPLLQVLRAGVAPGAAEKALVLGLRSGKPRELRGTATPGVVSERSASQVDARKLIEELRGELRETRALVETLRGHIEERKRASAPEDKPRIH